MKAIAENLRPVSPSERFRRVNLDPVPENKKAEIPPWAVGAVVGSMLAATAPSFELQANISTPIVQEGKFPSLNQLRVTFETPKAEAQGELRVSYSSRPREAMQEVAPSVFWGSQTKELYDSMEALKAEIGLDEMLYLGIPKGAFYFNKDGNYYPFLAYERGWYHPVNVNGEVKLLRTLAVRDSANPNGLELSENNYFPTPEKALAVFNSKPITGEPGSQAPTVKKMREKGLLTLNGAENYSQNKTGQPILEFMDAEANIRQLSPDEMPGWITNGLYINGHNIPQIIIDSYKAKYGSVNKAISILGLPIGEAYWVDSVIGGKKTRILVQPNERSTNTVNLGNEDKYKVEAGLPGNILTEGYYGSENPPEIGGPYEQPKSAAELLARTEVVDSTDSFEIRLTDSSPYKVTMAPELKPLMESVIKEEAQSPKGPEFKKAELVLLGSKDEFPEGVYPYQFGLLVGRGEKGEAIEHYGYISSQKEGDMALVYISVDPGFPFNSSRGKENMEYMMARDIFATTYSGSHQGEWPQTPDQINLALNLFSFTNR